MCMKQRPNKQKQKFAPAKPTNPTQNRVGGDNIIFYGRHAIEAALHNERREKLHLFATEKALSPLKDKQLIPTGLKVSVQTSEEIENLTGADVPHQGLAMIVRKLAGRHIDEFTLIENKPNIIVILDQVTDPQNVGAILRSSAAFGVRALVTTDRNAPPESGALAKAASGGLEIVPWVRATNLKRALEELAKLGYWSVGMSGDAHETLAQTNTGKNVALVMGSEGYGMRLGVEKSCDFLAKLPISSEIESLNVSVATSIALYEFAR